MLTIRILRSSATSKRTRCPTRTSRKLRMKVSQIIRLDSQKSKEELNKKINTEITEAFIQTKSTCPRHMNSDQLKEEPAKRTKMRTLRNSRKSDLKRSKARREPSSTSTRSKLRSPDKTRAARDTKTQWPPKKKIYKLELKWASPSLTRKLTSRTVTCYFSPRRRRKTMRD